MNVRSYEILARWIADQYNITIKWSNIDTCPSADMKNRIITLPTGIDEKNCYAALTQLIHESAHLNYTRQIPYKIVEDQLSHDILNVIEDVRIDRYNFDKLPNIHEFYVRGMNYEVEKRKKIDMSQVPMHKKILVNTICELERLPNAAIKEPEVEKLRKQLGISNMVEQGIEDIESKDWENLKKTIEKIMVALELDKLPKMPITNLGHVGGQGEEKKGDKSTGGDVDKGIPSADISDLTRDAGAFSGGGQGHQSAAGTAVLGAIAMQELTRNRFKEILDIKATKRIDEGNEINTENLTAFLTGQIDELFVEHIVERKKKSKILFVMDSSGSMAASLLDGKSRKEVVSGCVDQLTKILDEVSSIEGVNVDYEVAAFDDKYHPMSKHGWRTEYGCHGGGTDLIGSFKTAQEKVMLDKEVDGNRMIIFFSDGDVCESEIKQMEDAIRRSGSDVRVMIIGVGSEITGSFVDNIVGDNNIIAAECSDQILMDAICNMLD